MKPYLQFNIIVLLFIFVRCADLAINYAMGSAYIRATVYGVVGLLALIALILLLIV